ncbi:glycine-rich domain-containing protein [Nissabacter archeti]|uniref:glycine-rich domain-containing protein n=1 Tax=Nissabacter archeti TaxID=1917880 RepID=UPI00111517C4|nr:hypothetical protein [Nissabacter archeti]
MKSIIVKLVGAGASGGSGITVDADSYSAAGGGGGGGGYVEFMVDLAAAKLNQVSIVIGAGGKSVTGQKGNDGGVTYFGTTIFATGGGGAGIETRPVSAYTTSVSSLMIIPGLPGQGYFNETNPAYTLIRTAYGQHGGWGYLGAQGQLGGSGGASALSGEAYYMGNGAAGDAGTSAGYGTGGGGSCTFYNVPAPLPLAYNAKPSGAGADGVVLIYEFA